MAISFAQLRFAEPSPEARRRLWHVLSIGSVLRDEPERHEGLDKAGLFLFRCKGAQGSYPKVGATCGLIYLFGLVAIGWSPDTKKLEE